MRILIVDDEPSLLLTLAANLELEGFETACAGSGAEALEMFRKEPFDIVLSDIRMPGMHGVDLFRRVREVAPDVPVVLMTGFAVEELVADAIREGAFAVLPKPFDMDRAIRALTHAIHSSVVLFIDRAEAEATVDALRAVGLRTLRVQAPPEAVAAVQRGEVDVCVVDLGISGAVDSISAMRAVDPAIVHIALGGAGAAEAVRQAAARGAFACLRKPLGPDDLVQAIARARATGAR